MNNMSKSHRKTSLVPLIYTLFLMLPIYWLINMSFKTNLEISAAFTLIPNKLTFESYNTIFTDPSWYMGYVNSMIYVALNILITIVVALPAAYAFSRYRFLGAQQLFFWFLAFRMTPPVILLIPFVQLYSSLGLIDKHIGVALAHCLFTVPITIWILEGFISSIPTEIDETAKIDGYSFTGFFIKILIPLIAPGIGVAAFFCFMYSWVEILLANALTVVDTKPIGSIMTTAGGAFTFLNMSLLAAASVVSIIPGVIMLLFVHKHIAKGFALGQIK